MFKKIIKDFSPKEKKSYLNSTASFYVPGLMYDQSTLNIRECIDYYYNSSPLFTGLKLIADNLKQINFVLKDTRKDEFVYDHPILDLLNAPNPFVNSHQFIESIISFFILSGDTYISITGSTKPIELNILPTQYIRIQRNHSTGIIAQYDYQPNSGGSISYVRDENNKYVSANGNELINLRNFNPDLYSDNQGGLPYIEAIKLELSQYLFASVHNDALLQNHGRPDGMLTYKGDGVLGEDQIEDVKAQIKEGISGPKNAGKSMFLSANFDWKQLSESIKDMDFANLKTQTSISIYNALKIPLPMVSPDHMTLANMETAKLNFYDNCIIPHFEMISSFLGNSLLSRYNGSENLKLTYDEAQISALQPRLTENTEKLSESGVLTVNEIRSLLGYEDIENGDTLYQPMNLVPIGEDKYTNDNREKPAKKDSYSEVLEFKKYLTSQIDAKGNRVFKEEEIERLTLEQYGSIN